jgi:hypothetical protein
MIQVILVNVFRHITICILFLNSLIKRKTYMFIERNSYLIYLACQYSAGLVKVGRNSIPTCSCSLGYLARGIASFDLVTSDFGHNNNNNI